MKKKYFIILILCLAATCLFAGCSDNVTRESLEKQYGNGVRLDLVLGEGGSISGQSNVSTYYYFSRGSDGMTQLVEPGKGALEDLKLSKSGHFLEGWYSDPEFKNKWDFSKRTADDVVLYAKWLPHFRYEFYYRDETTGEETKLDYSLNVGQGEALRESNISGVTREDHTLLGLYKDLDCSTEWDYSFTHPGTVENGESVNTAYKVYTKWINGTYVLVKDVGDFAAISAETNYYFLTDVDFSKPDKNDVYYDWYGGSVDYAGTIIGNGFTVKGIKAKFPIFGSRDENWGIFKSLCEGAKIANITFEQVEVVVNDTLSMRRKIGLLAGTIQSEVTFNNFKLSGKISLIAAAYPQNYTIGLIAGEFNGSVAGLTAAVDIDNRVDGYVWALDDTDPNANEVLLTQVTTE